MPLRDLLISFLAAALASLVFCVLKIAFDSAAVASGSAFRLHRPSALVSSAETGVSVGRAAPLKGKEKGKGKRKGLKSVSFGQEEVVPRGDPLDPGVHGGSRGKRTLGEGRRGGGRKLSVVLEE